MVVEALKELIPAGYYIEDDFSAFSDVVTSSAGAGVALTAPTVILTHESPRGVLVLIETISGRVVDEALYDQIFFSLRRNGAPMMPHHHIPGEQLAFDTVVPVGLVVHPGAFQVTAKNITGTSQSGAAAAFDVRVAASIRGKLLRAR